MKSGIYCIKNLVTGQIYIGSAQSIRKRWNSHRSCLKNGSHQNAYLQRAWNKYGEHAFEFSVIEHVTNSSGLIVREQYWLDNSAAHVSKGGYNISPTAESPSGVKHTDETRALVSAAHKGIPKAPEHRRKIGDANRGKVRSKDARARCAAAQSANWQDPGYRAHLISKLTGKPAYNKGKSPSAETRAKMSESAKARVSTPEGKARLAKMGELARSEEARRKNSESKLGKKASDEARAKMSQAHLGKKCPSRGRPHDDAWRKHHSERLKGRSKFNACEAIESMRSLQEQGSSYEEIATILGCHPVTVRKYLRKAAA